MWINRSKYKNLCDDNDRLRARDHELDVILEGVAMAKDGVITVRDVVIMSRENWYKFIEQLQTEKDAVRKITAERDWYKQKYAEMIIHDDMKGYFYE